jgi:hypothetical protein
MSVLEPVTRLETPAPAAVPDQREVPAAAPAPVAGIDHVRSHGVSCYWDVAQCRWMCARD